METYDVIVVGGGPGGLAAAASARQSGAERVLLLERDDILGGILNQCIHDGFGLTRYKAQLSGPEYAARGIQEAMEAGVEFRTGCMVTDLSADKVITAVSRDGLQKLLAGAVVLATGCRERIRGTLSIPGTRPAGIFTAGVAQNLVNCRNIMPGRKVVILGSGDIGLIMARRLTLEGAEVLGVVEIMSEPGGLTRNVNQCVLEYGIPLYLEHTISRIIGKRRLEAVEISKVDAEKNIIPGTAQIVACDTLVLSVGLIPENEVAKGAGVALNIRTNGVVTDSYLQTNIPGVFSCGNSRSVMDLADFVSEQGELAGKNAVRYIQGKQLEPWNEKSRHHMQKGFPIPGITVCTMCPNGCQVRLKEDGEVEGNRCSKGKEFALQEDNSPERILTTTIRVKGASTPLVAVRSDRPVKRRELKGLVEKLHGQIVEAPIHLGQVLFSGVGENYVNIIAEHAIV